MIKFLVAIIFKALNNLPQESHEEYLNNLDEYKKIIDRTPNKFLEYHLKTCLKKEQYELAEYIKITAQNRGFLISI